jgi:hypothetical protein
MLDTIKKKEKSLNFKDSPLMKACYELVENIIDAIYEFRE